MRPRIRSNNRNVQSNIKVRKGQYRYNDGRAYTGNRIHMHNNQAMEGAYHSDTPHEYLYSDGYPMGEVAGVNTMGQTTCWCTAQSGPGTGMGGAALPGCCPAGMNPQSTGGSSDMSGFRRRRFDMGTGGDNMAYRKRARKRRLPTRRPRLGRDRR